MLITLCVLLLDVLWKQILFPQRYFFAVYEIEALIEDSYTLTSYLVGVLGHDGKHIPLKIAIYKDWDNRHQLIAQEKLKLDKELSDA